MQRVAAAAVERLSRAARARSTDFAEMARVTLEVLEQTLFSQGLGRDAERIPARGDALFRHIGRLDPLDLLGAPQFLPRFGRLRGRATLEFFARAVDDIIGGRQALLAGGEAAPNDMLTLLLRAQGPRDRQRRQRRRRARQHRHFHRRRP